MSAPRAPREAADARECVVAVAGDRVLLRVHFHLRLAAVAEDLIAALKVLDEALHLLIEKLHLLRALRDLDRLLAFGTDEENVICKCRLNEASRHRHATVLRTLDRLAGPVLLRKLTVFVDFGGHERMIQGDERLKVSSLAALKISGCLAARSTTEDTESTERHRE